jgi:hypothetical protein
MVEKLQNDVVEFFTQTKAVVECWILDGFRKF